MEFLKTDLNENMKGELPMRATVCRIIISWPYTMMYLFACMEPLCARCEEEEYDVPKLLGLH